MTVIAVATLALSIAAALLALRALSGDAPSQAHTAGRVWEWISIIAVYAALFGVSCLNFIE